MRKLPEAQFILIVLLLAITIDACLWGYQYYRYSEVKDDGLTAEILYTTRGERNDIDTYYFYSVDSQKVFLTNDFNAKSNLTNKSIYFEKQVLYMKTDPGRNYVLPHKIPNTPIMDLVLTFFLLYFPLGFVNRRLKTRTNSQH